LPDAALHVREGTDQDVPSIVELLKASLGEGSIPRTTAFWNWKHGSSPFGRSPFWVAESDGRIVGVRVFMRWTWTANATKVETVRAVDTATHPDFMGKGIFRTLTLHGVNELARRGVAFVFNTPNAKSRPGYLKMGWSTVGRTTLWVAPRSPIAAVRVAYSRLQRQPAAGKPDDEDRSEAVSFDMPKSHDILKLIAASRDESNRYQTELDAAYLDWRYARCPGHRYKFTLDDSGRALVVHRVRRRAGAREVAICELIFDRRRATVRDLSRVIRRVLRSSEADYGVVAPPLDTRSSMALVLAGFVPAPRMGPILTVRPLSDAMLLPDPLTMRSWGMTIGSLELF
jgi:Acetyltransferase (GNAT) domain